jgi:hypothetical protein
MKTESNFQAKKEEDNNVSAESFVFFFQTKADNHQLPTKAC